MTDRRIKKIRELALDLTLCGGADVMFIAELPDDPIGKGAVYVFGSSAGGPSAMMCARRTLNELKHHLRKIGLDFEYQLTFREESNE